MTSSLLIKQSWILTSRIFGSIYFWNHIYTSKHHTLKEIVTYFVAPLRNSLLSLWCIFLLYFLGYLSLKTLRRNCAILSTFKFLKIIYFSLCVCTCLSVGMAHECSAHRGQEKVTVPETGVIDSYECVLQTKPGFSGINAIFYCWVFLQPEFLPLSPIFCFKGE